MSTRNKNFILNCVTYLNVDSSLESEFRITRTSSQEAGYRWHYERRKLSVLRSRN